ncbi:glutathione S-transferase family protein [Candidatus Accumulibacter phosphatis]|uniref:Glutathione S-transferase family protein n=1 Tax=Candidatus Accumulibacter phosphatis TaxID=327160 RepID=A0ABX1TRP2_9PROT|nr:MULTISPECIES: glutathione S-transferase family protein [Candidatus Accumulibacter]NMQ26906.1 glutathione S-transferase family protein [Candidatus Accumulibacter phosphatis]
MQLFIGNKNYSSWSMRPWVLLRQAEIPFAEVMLRFDAFTPDSKFKTELARHSPAGRVPVLVDDGFAVWDTLAIAEYLAEKYPDRQLWPVERQARARARSVCAEMHAGFGALRSHLPMNIEAALPEIGQRVLREQAAVRADVDRLVQMWSELLVAHGGPLLFGKFSIADAFFAPVVKRLVSYAVPVPAAIAAYIERVQALPGVLAWSEGALAEHDFLDFEEPYRTCA